ncbi:hypothetical protein [Streptomyces sp. NPDC059759]|uniref:hypothetical protein n=1 Tax=unclassified Streptomyces TaxID=2593676 RepID=UPI00364F7383
MDTATGIVFGNAYGFVEQEINTSSTSISFGEDFSFELLDADVGTAGMTVEVDSRCSIDTSCREGSGPWEGVPHPVTVGVPLEGTWERSWAGTEGNKQFIIDYDLTVTIGSLAGTTGWGGDLEPADGLYSVRCDNEIGQYPGCIVPDFTPTFNVDDVKYPGGSDYINDAQDYIKTHPGAEDWSTKTPLHRESSTEQADKNRRKVCDSSFEPEDWFDGEHEIQCDEYPFAKSKESGGQLGIASGSECKQFALHPGYEEFEPLTPHAMFSYVVSGNANCARASMTKTDNEGVGGDLGRFYVANKILEDDPYWVNALSWSERCGCTG